MLRIRLVKNTIVALSLSLLLLTAYSGCGGDSGPTRYNVYGTVSVGGTPIPGGVVTFTNLETNAGASCPIEDGSYENEDDGAVAGKNRISVTARNDQGAMWQKPYVTEVEVPAESFEYNIDVPQGAVTAATGPEHQGADEYEM